jgi:integrase
MAWTEKLPSGKHRGTYRLPDGRKRSAGTFPKQKEALNAAAAAERDAHSLGWRDPRSGLKTWGDWVEAWWATRDVEASTLKRDASRRDHRLMPRWRDVPLVDITRHDAKAWAAELKRDGLAPATVQRCVHLLSASLAAAVDSEIIPTNPAARLKLTAPRALKERYLTNAEQSQLLDELPEGRDRALVATLLGTGIRWGEAAGLQVPRVDLKRRRLRVVEVWDDSNNLLKPYPKGKRYRTVPIPDWVAVELEQIVGDRKAGHVFTTPDGGPIDYHNWRSRVWAPAVARAKVAPVTIHDCRHTYASVLLQNGVSLEVVRKLLGHESVATSQIYAHLVDDQDDVVEFLPAPQRGANVGQETTSRDSNVLPFTSRRSG